MFSIFILFSVCYIYIIFIDWHVSVLAKTSIALIGQLIYWPLGDTYTLCSILESLYLYIYQEAYMSHHNKRFDHHIRSSSVLNILKVYHYNN